MNRLSREETLSNSNMQMTYSAFLQEQLEKHRIDNVREFRKKVSDFTFLDPEKYRCYEYGDERSVMNYGIVLPLVRKEFKELETNLEYNKKLRDLMYSLNRNGFCPPSIGELDKWCESKGMVIKSNFFDFQHNYQKEYELVCKMLQRMLNKKETLSFDDINEENLNKIQERFDKVKERLESPEVNMRITYASTEDAIEGTRRVMAVNPIFQPDTSVDKNYSKEIATINENQKIGWLSNEFFKLENKLIFNKISEVQGWANPKLNYFHCWQQPNLDLLHFIKLDENKVAPFEKNLPQELIDRDIFSLYVAPRTSKERIFTYIDINGEVKSESVTTYRYEKKPFDPRGNNGKGAFAQSNNPDTWLDFQKACWYAKNQIIFNKIMDENRRFSGRTSLNGKAVFALGLPLNGDGWVAIDIDHCIDEDGIMDKKAANMMNKLKGYWEYSASGTGIHGLFKLPKEYIKELPRSRFTNEEGLDVEFYKDGRIMAITGEVVEKYNVLSQEENKEMFSANLGLITPVAYTREQSSHRINLAREGSFTRNSVILNVAFQSQNDLYLRDDEIVAKLINMQQPKAENLICKKIYEDLNNNKNYSKLYGGVKEENKADRFSAIQKFVSKYHMNPYKLFDKKNNVVDEKLVKSLTNESLSKKSDIIEDIEKNLKPLFDMKKTLENNSAYSNPFERFSIYADFENQYLFEKFGDDRSKIEGAIIDMACYFTTSPSQIKSILENYTNLMRPKWYEDRFNVTYKNENGEITTLRNISYIDSIIISAVSNYNEKIQKDIELYDGKTDKVWNPYTEQEKKIIEERKKHNDVNFGKTILNKYENVILEKHKSELANTTVDIEYLDRNRENHTHAKAKNGGVEKTKLDPVVRQFIEERKYRYGGAAFSPNTPYPVGTLQSDIGKDFNKMVFSASDDTESSASEHWKKVDKNKFEKIMNNEDNYLTKLVEAKLPKIELLNKLDAYLTKEKELER